MRNCRENNRKVPDGYIEAEQLDGDRLSQLYRLKTGCAEAHITGIAIIG